MMTAAELRLALDTLHQELATHSTLSPDLHDPARQVLHDLARLLTARGAAEEDDVPAHPTSAGLRDMLIEFEADHPKLAQTLGRIADGLQNLGI